MAQSFNVEEVFEIACQIERNGARFYRAAAGIVTDESARSLLKKLAEYEDQHEKTFAELKAQVAAVTSNDDDFWSDIDDMAGRYVRAMAAGVVFEGNTDATGLTGSESFDDILKLALNAENESIAFYTGIKELMPATWDPTQLDAIIREEMQHVVTLSDQRAGLE